GGGAGGGEGEELGVDDVVGAGGSARAEAGSKANPRRGLGRGDCQQGSGNDKRGESPSHLIPLRLKARCPGNAASPCPLHLAKLRAPAFPPARLVNQVGAVPSSFFFARGHSLGGECRPYLACAFRRL